MLDDQSKSEYPAMLTLLSNKDFDDNFLSAKCLKVNCIHHFVNSNRLGKSVDIFHQFIVSSVFHRTVWIAHIQIFTVTKN